MFIKSKIKINKNKIPVMVPEAKRLKRGKLLRVENVKI